MAPNLGPYPRALFCSFLRPLLPSTSLPPSLSLPLSPCPPFFDSLSFTLFHVVLTRSLTSEPRPHSFSTPLPGSLSGVSFTHRSTRAWRRGKIGWARHFILSLRERSLRLKFAFSCLSLIPLSSFLLSLGPQSLSFHLFLLLACIYTKFYPLAESPSLIYVRVFPRKLARDSRLSHGTQSATLWCCLYIDISAFANPFLYSSRFSCLCSQLWIQKRYASPNQPPLFFPGTSFSSIAHLLHSPVSRAPIRVLFHLNFSRFL